MHERRGGENIGNGGKKCHGGESNQVADCWANSKHELSISDRWVWETTQSCKQVYREMLGGAFNTDIIVCKCLFICTMLLGLSCWPTFLSIISFLRHSQGLMGVRSEFNSNAPIWSIKSHSVPKQGLFLYGTIYSAIFIMYREGKMEMKRSKEKKTLFLVHELKGWKFY